MRRQNPRRRPRPSSSAFQPLEGRTLFALPTLVTLPNVTVLAGAPLQIPLDGFDADAADALTFTVTSNNANVVPTISPSTNRSLKITVNHVSSGAAGDVAITNESMVIKLFEDKAPLTTARIIALANSGFYNGKIFHRVINNFVIQGGDPLGNGTGGSGVEFDDEFNAGLQFTGRGLLAMAKSSDDTNDSQFFITESNPRHLDFNHTIFGQLVEGESTREKISNLPVGAGDKPLADVVTTSITVIPDKQNGVLSLTVPNNVASGTATITVTAKDPANNTTSRTFTVTIAPDLNNNDPFLLPIADVTTTANTAKTLQLQATEVDAGTPFFGIGGNPNADVAYTINATGLVTVTPSNNFAGVVPLLVGVAPVNNFGGSFDSQFVPVFISPASPTSIDLLDVSDTGTSTTDNLTRLNNANAGAKLQFQVNGVRPGAVVTLKEGNTVLGSATVPAGQTSVVITTNGSASLANGTRNLVATQLLDNVAWSAGNRSGTIDLQSANSAAFALTVDTAPPGLSATPFFTWQSAAQSFTFQFTENVGPSLDGGDLLIRTAPPDLVTPVTTIPAANIQVDWNAGTKVARFTLLNYPHGTLPDDNYTFTLVLGGITDPAGNPLGGAPTFPFFSLAGDANHSGGVNFDDLVPLAQNYNVIGGRDYTTGDFTGDGNTDFNDLVVLAQNYNKTLPTPLAGAAPAASAATTTFAEDWGAVRSVPVLAPTTGSKEKPAKALFSTTPVAKPVAKPKPAARPVRR